MKRLTSIAIMLFVIIASKSYGQQPAHKNKLDKNLIKFFSGSWAGTGQFANGKQIAANATFTISLDSCWLTYTHADKAPNMYKATSMWGIDVQTGNFLAYTFDNFQGHRMFTGKDWDGHILSFTFSQLQKDVKTYQRFNYEVLDKYRFKMTYEVSRDSINWREGDHLTFTRDK